MIYTYIYIYIYTGACYTLIDGQTAINIWAYAILQLSQVASLCHSNFLIVNRNKVIYTSTAGCLLYNPSIQEN